MYQTTRGEVMEKGVAIEAGISGILGFILDIDTENSNSFGHRGSALSFNAKVNLLTDLKFVPKDIAKKFQLFSEIRNKFAHVQSVDSFTTCFEILKDKKAFFLKEFGKEIPVETNEEIKLGTCFDFLILQLGLWMNLILTKSHNDKSQELKKTAVIEMLRSFLNSNAPKIGTDEDKRFLNQIDNLVKDIKQDAEFTKSVEEAINFGNRENKETQI